MIPVPPAGVEALIPKPDRVNPDSLWSAANTAKKQT
jgi:hypothetical protein